MSRSQWAETLNGRETARATTLLKAGYAPVSSSEDTAL